MYECFPELYTATETKILFCRFLNPRHGIIGNSMYSLVMCIWHPYTVYAVLCYVMLCTTNGIQEIIQFLSKINRTI